MLRLAREKIARSKDRFPMFQLSLRLADHVRRYSITPANPSGWEVTLEEDRELRRRDLYEDWHRVERAMALFELEVLQLRASGWALAE
jgi:hypothetical protein